MITDKSEKIPKNLLWYQKPKKNLTIAFAYK
jgi:hypothetical protein